jgi:MFS family permease
VLGGVLVQATWRLVFFVNAPIGAALLVGSWRLLPPDPPRRESRVDFPGALTVTAGVAIVVFAVTRAGDTLSVAEPALFGAAGIVLLAAFVVVERTARSPLLDLALFRDRGILGANLCLIGLGAFNAGEVLLIALYLQQGRHLSPVLTGLCFVPQAVGAFLLSGPASNLVPRLGPRRGLAVAMTVALVALTGGALAVAAGSLVALLASLLLLGVAARLTQVAATLAGTSGPVAARSEGTASALLTATRQCGSALGVAVVSAALVAVHGSVAHRTAVGMFVAAGFALFSLLATRVIPRGAFPVQKAKPEHRFTHQCGGVA